MALTLRLTDLERSPRWLRKKTVTVPRNWGRQQLPWTYAHCVAARISQQRRRVHSAEKVVDLRCLVIPLVSSAMAQSRVCAADIKEACANIEPGGGRIAACVKEKFNNFSDGCKARLAEVAAAAKTCREEVNKECGSVQGLKKVACVKDALSKFSDGCKASISAVVSGGKN